MKIVWLIECFEYVFSYTKATGMPYLGGITRFSFKLEENVAKVMHREWSAPLPCFES